MMPSMMSSDSRMPWSIRPLALMPSSVSFLDLRAKQVARGKMWGDAEALLEAGVAWVPFPEPGRRIARVAVMLRYVGRQGIKPSAGHKKMGLKVTAGPRSRQTPDTGAGVGDAPLPAGSDQPATLSGQQEQGHGNQAAGDQGGRSTPPRRTHRPTASPARPGARQPGHASGCPRWARRKPGTG